MRSIVAVSTAGETGQALAEVRHQLESDPDGAAPDLALLFASPHHRDSLEEIVAELRRAINPRCLLGCTGGGLIGAEHEYEGAPALVVFAAGLPGVTLEPFHASFQLEGEGGTGTLSGFPFDRLEEGDDPAVLLFGDPFTFPMDALLRLSNEKVPGVPLIGGMASGATVPGQNRLVLDDAVVEQGTVGVVVAGDVRVETIVSQGCRPVGRHAIITKGSQNVIEELGGRPALAVLQGLVDELDERDRRLFQSALHIGRAINEYQSDFKRGDFLVRSIMGIDQGKGAIAINDYIRRGQTVQFHVRDPASATQDLDLLLQEHAARFREHPPRGALLFSCNGRGTHMFGTPDHDIGLLARHVPGVPVAGFFAGGEIGPVGGQNFLHGFTASMAFFCGR